MHASALLLHALLTEVDQCAFALSEGSFEHLESRQLPAVATRLQVEREVVALVEMLVAVEVGLVHPARARAAAM